MTWLIYLDHNKSKKEDKNSLDFFKAYVVAILTKINRIKMQSTET